MGESWFDFSAVSRIRRKATTRHRGQIHSSCTLVPTLELEPARPRRQVRELGASELELQAAGGTTMTVDPSKEVRSRLVAGGEDWRLLAKCTGVEPEVFFPTRGQSNEAAKAVCRGCPVRSPCLEYALEIREPFGVWGGLSEIDRRKIRRARRRAAGEREAG